MGARPRILLVLCIAVAAARGLAAHAELLSSEPAAGSVAATPPSRLSITFSEAVESTGDALELFAPDGTRVRLEAAATLAAGDSHTIQAPVGALSTGTYTVRWRVLSEDGHPINGTFQFSVGAPGAAAAPAAAAPAPPSVAWSAAARAFHLIALSALIGPLIFLLVVKPPFQRIHQRLWRVMVWGSVAILAAAALMFLAQAAAVFGTLSAAVQRQSVSSLLATHWGWLWLVRTGSALVAIALACVGRYRSVTKPGTRHTMIAATLAIPGVVLLTTTVMNGHAAATAPISVSLPIDWLHLVATTAWIGGLVALVAAVFPVLRTAQPKDRDRALAPLVTRFSTLALICVEILILTGLYQTWVHVDSPASLTSTAYGRALLTKLAIIAAMMLPAAINLFIIRPQLQRPPAVFDGDLYRRFRWTVSAELVLAVMVLAVVGSLTSTQPARVEAAARTAPPAPVVSSDQGVTMADHVGATLVLLNVSPVRVGSNQLEIQLQDPAGGAARAAVRLRIVPPEGSGVSPWTVTPVLDGNIYRATAALAPEGNWKVEVLTANSEEPTAGAVFALDVPARGVRDLLTASATRMNRLQSAMEQVETFADGIRSVATVVYRAPDRERWTGNATEDSEITIGSNRFVRGANGRWIGEPVSHFHWPAFAPHEATEPMLLGRERVDDTECFVIAYVSPADGSRHRAWIATDDLRMLRHSEAAPGRFVVNHYSSFDAPVQIEAPALR